MLYKTLLWLFIVALSACVGAGLREIAVNALEVSRHNREKHRLECEGVCRGFGQWRLDRKTGKYFYEPIPLSADRSTEDEKLRECLSAGSR
jgi:hypothetical protein